MLARPARRATYHRALRSGELIPQNERELCRSEGSGTITELWGGGETRTLRRERHAHR